MKIKKFYLFAATAMALASCSSSDELGTSSASRQAITFESPFVSKTSRATGDLTTGNINTTQIKVWGDQYSSMGEGWGSISPVFNHEPATLTYARSTDWKCNQLAFWESNMWYNFTAVAPANYEAEMVTVTGPVFNTRTLKIPDIPVVQEINNEDGAKSGDDILVSTVRSVTEETQKVQLSFQHILSRFSIYVYSSDVQEPTDNDNLTINKLTIYLPAERAKASYSQKDNGWVKPGEDTWEWTGFPNQEQLIYDEDDSELSQIYQKYDLITEPTRLNYAAGADDALTKVATKIGKEFFIAPTPLDYASSKDLQLYMKVEYVSRKGNSTISRTRLVPIQGLHSFKQGSQTNLFVNLHLAQSDPQALEFGSMSLDDWSETPNDGQFNVK